MHVLDHVMRCMCGLTCFPATTAKGAVRVAQIIDHPAAFCHRLPAGLSHEQGAMCEPFSVGVHAARRGRVAPGCSVAVIGAGPIGAHATRQGRCCSFCAGSCADAAVSGVSFG